MRSRLAWSCVAVVGLVIGTATLVLAQTPLPASPPPASEDLAGLRVAAERFVRALGDLDWEPFRATWASEPTVFFPFADTPDRVAGRTGVEARPPSLLARADQVIE